jgi:hypothetical protein
MYTSLIIGSIFILLKLAGYITWPWWLVTLPLWGVVALISVAIFSLLLATALVLILTSIDYIFGLDSYKDER